MSKKTTNDDTQKDKTTLRTNVTAYEHDAIKWIAKTKLGITIDLLVRDAVDMYLQKHIGKDIATLAEENKKRGKLIQEDLFDGRWDWN